MIRFGFKKDNNNQMKAEISSSPVGQLTESEKSDFYVYEWYIKETGEIFYVGKGRGNRYKEYHEHAYDAEKIKTLFNTDVRFVANNLTESQAVELESEEMTRILNNTNYRLTNRIIPLFTKRGNGYDPSPNTPKLKFECAPNIYVTEIDEHYYGSSPRNFDKVSDEALSCVYIIETGIHPRIKESVYGNNYNKYYDETIAMLKLHNSKILKTKYAKSVGSWIYLGDEDKINYDIDQRTAVERIGHEVPAFHLIDVWHYLKTKYKSVQLSTDFSELILPEHHRIPLKSIKNYGDWDAGFAEGSPLYFQGEELRKSGQIEDAITLFDKARALGYNAPALYNSYAKAFRKIKAYSDEVVILDEAISRTQEECVNCDVTKFKSQRDTALENLKKQHKSK